MTLAAAATVLHGTMRGTDAEFSGVSTDTRTLRRGDLFVALVGPNFDGHGFVNDAAGKGAVGALVSRVSVLTPENSASVPRIVP